MGGGGLAPKCVQNHHRDLRLTVGRVTNVRRGPARRGARRSTRRVDDGGNLGHVGSSGGPATPARCCCSRTARCCATTSRTPATVSGSNRWYKLGPDANGNYETGTWARLAEGRIRPCTSLAEVLNDGRVFIAGGEYNGRNAQVELLASEIYDPSAPPGRASPRPRGGRRSATPRPRCGPTVGCCWATSAVSARDLRPGRQHVDGRSRLTRTIRAAPRRHGSCCRTRRCSRWSATTSRRPRSS